MCETSKHLFACRLECVDAQIDRRARGKRAHLSDGAFPEDGGKGRLQPLRIIARDKAWSTTQIAAHETFSLSLVERRRRMRLARTERRQRAGIHATSPAQRAENDRAGRFATHEERARGSVALRIEDERRDRRAILGARETM